MPMSQGSEVVAHANNTIMEEKMKVFLAVAGPVAGNFIAWTLITLLPVHPMILFVLAIASGILMISGIVCTSREQLIRAKQLRANLDFEVWRQ